MRKVLTKVLLLAIVVTMFYQNNRFEQKIQGINVKIYNNLNKTLDVSVLDSCGIITDDYGWGSCVAIAPNLILTAGHCIDITDSYIEISGYKYNIVSKWKSNEYDIGIIEIDGIVPFVKLGEMPKLLDTVYLIGSPYDKAFKNSITKGIVSKLDIVYMLEKSLIQVDAEAAPGSSGCPLFNNNGELLGIVIGGPNPGGGVVVCVPISHIKEALEEYNAKSTT